MELKIYYKVNRLLQTYKARKVKIMNLRQERNAFNYDEERVKLITKEVNNLNYYQQKIKNGLLILNESEREIIYKRYMDLDYIFKDMLGLGIDLNKSYALLSKEYKNAMSKLKSWEDGKELY